MLEEELNSRNDNFIHIETVNEEESEYTRSVTSQKIYHRWSNGDELGLYARGVMDKEGNSAVNLGNQKMTASVSGNNVSFGQLAFQWSEDLQDFYIYYPYKADSQTEYNDHQIKVRGALPSTQTQTGAYEKSESNGCNFLYRIYKGIGKPGDGTLYLRDFSSFFPTYQFTVLCTDQSYVDMEVQSLEITADSPFNTGGYTIDLTKVNAGTSALQWDDSQSTVESYKIDLKSSVKLVYNMPVNIFVTLPPIGITTLNCKLSFKDKSGQIHTFVKTMKDQNLTVGKSIYTYILMGDEVPPSSSEKEANCYILKPEQQIYIPVSQVNVANAFDATISGITTGEILTSELVWTDVKGSESGKGLATDASIAEIKVIGKGPQAVLAVKAGTKSGNSVVAIKDATGTIKWSWHIWVTDYNPEQENGQNTSGGYIFMDRNLGAKTNVPNINGVNVIGNYYQYGRKDPFPTKNDASGFVTTYNAAGAVVAQTANVATTSAGNQIRNPYLWGNATGYPTDLELWGESGKKTVNDPCPLGWRVPSSSAWVDLNNYILPIDATGTGRKGAHTGFYPYTYYKDVNGNFNAAKLVTNWTSTSSGTVNGLILRADASGSVLGNYAWGRANGHGIRCVRDWTLGKQNNEVRILQTGGNRMSSCHQLNAGERGSAASAVLPMHVTNFGPGGGYNALFKYYGFNPGAGKFSELITHLRNNEIDILYISHSTYPNAEDAKLTKEWLAEDKNRVMMVSIDGSGNTPIVNEYGFTRADYVGGNAGVTYNLYDGMPDNSTFKFIAKTGPFGSITKMMFKKTEGSGHVSLDRARELGYVPILCRTTPINRVDLAINPELRIVLLGDIRFLDNAWTSNADGSLTPLSDGSQYPQLFANLWAWMADTALKDR